MAINGIPQHVFGTKAQVAQALEEGVIGVHDIIFMENADGNEIGWINSSGNLVIGGKEIDLDDIVTIKTTNEWINDLDYVPKKGEMVVYSDYRIVVENNVEKNIPSIKIGDGEHSIRQLSFVNGGTVDKLEHKLTIGTNVYDGSQDINIPVYAGEI